MCILYFGVQYISVVYTELRNVNNQNDYWERWMTCIYAWSTELLPEIFPGLSFMCCRRLQFGVKCSKCHPQYQGTIVLTTYHPQTIIILLSFIFQLCKGTQIHIQSEQHKHTIIIHVIQWLQDMVLLNVIQNDFSVVNCSIQDGIVTSAFV